MRSDVFSSAEGGWHERKIDSDSITFKIFPQLVESAKEKSIFFEFILLQTKVKDEK